MNCPASLCIHCLLFIFEEPRQHIHETKLSQCLCRGAKFNVIIRRGGRRAAQPIRPCAKELRYNGLALAIEVFQDTRFITYNPNKILCIE